MIDIIIVGLSNSTNKDIEKTINSILYQYLDNIKYNIYLLNYNLKDYKEIIDYYSKMIKIKEIKPDKKIDICHAKEFSLDSIKGDYFTFINSGDVFSNPFAISLLHNTIEEKKLDAVFSSYIKEENKIFKTIFNDKLFSYGKIYSRNFIKNNNIGFSSSKVNDSLSFNRLVLLKSNNVLFIDDATYMVQEKNNINFNINYEVDYTNNYLNEIEYILNNYMSIKNYDKTTVGELSITAIYYSYLNYLVNESFSKMDKKSVSNIISIYNDHKLSKGKEKLVKKSCIDGEIIIDYLINSCITFDDYIKEVSS